MSSGIFYPVESLDDGRHGGSPNFQYGVNHYMVLGRSASFSYDAWIRFVNVTIPQGATIESAFVRLTADRNETSTTVRTDWYFNLEPNADQPISRADLLADTLTNSHVDWDSIASWSAGVQYDTPDLSTPLQEVIDLPGWTSGNALLLQIRDDASGPGDALRRALPVDNNGGADKAELHITWSEPATTALPDIQVKDGTWKNPRLYINSNGWKQPKDVWVKQDGTWVKVYGGIVTEINE